MATVSECESALREVAARLASVDAGVRDAHAVDRTWSCHIVDIDADFSGRIEGGTIASLVAAPNPAAQIKLAVGSDDLLALTRGDLNARSAVAAGRLRVDASVFDLLKLRSLF
ncbi:MAG: sterol-binding protein [Pseudonocardiales bacterium]|nr:MAG: sterol-binding protein [Pseudonocardiales bacterium]